MQRDTTLCPVFYKRLRYVRVLYEMNNNNEIYIIIQHYPRHSCTVHVVFCVLSDLHSLSVQYWYGSRGCS